MTTAAHTLTAQGRPTVAEHPRELTLRQRATMVASSAMAAVLGILPHVLHHAGLLAGAALLAGTAGSLLFGAIGLIAAIPFLIRLHRRFGSWRIPAGVLALMAVMFSTHASRTTALRIIHAFRRSSGILRPIDASSDVNERLREFAMSDRQLLEILIVAWSPGEAFEGYERSKTDHLDPGRPKDNALLGISLQSRVVERRVTLREHVQTPIRRLRHDHVSAIELLVRDRTPVQASCPPLLDE